MLCNVCSEDLDACVALFAETFSRPPMCYESIDEEKARRYISDLMRTPGFMGFLFYYDAMPAGLCLGSVEDYFFDPQYLIKEFAVLPEYQRCGIGTRMLQAVETYLAERGVVYMLLQTSRDIPAFAFYVKNGYDVIENNASFGKLIKKDA